MFVLGRGEGLICVCASRVNTCLCWGGGGGGGLIRVCAGRVNMCLCWEG